VDPRAGLDDVEKRKLLALPGLELRTFGRPAVASRYTDYAITAHWTINCRRKKWAGHIAESVRRPYEMLFGKPEVQRPHGRYRSRWEENVIMNLKGLG
jgi:hypothetical protein